jgi:hypothetical protein
MPLYLRAVLSFRGIEIRDAGKITGIIRDVEEKRTRLIVAFRHAYGDEPQLLFHVFDNLIPRWAKKNGQPLSRNFHLRLVHDYAVPLWGGAFIRFILPRAGALPVYHVKFDAASLRDIRSILSDGPCPLGLAPEGQISYHSETLPRIEQGTARLGFWCAKDLEKAGRSEKALILPISIHYEYDPRDAKKLWAAMDHLEALCGITRTPGRPDSLTDAAALQRLTERMGAVEARALELAEAFYERTCGYRRPLPDAGRTDEDRLRRWAALRESALDAAEQTLGIARDGADSVLRMYRIRLEGWGRIYHESSLNGLSPLDKALANRQAGEAWYAMRHMEFVDLMSYYDPYYLRGRQGSAASFDRVVETVVSLQDLVFRLMGGNISNRPNVIRKRAVIVPGRCVDLTERLPAYRVDAKQAARDATDALAESFEDCIKEYLNGKER